MGLRMWKIRARMYGDSTVIAENILEAIEKAIKKTELRKDEIHKINRVELIGEAD